MKKSLKLFLSFGFVLAGLGLLGLNGSFPMAGILIACGAGIHFVFPEKIKVEVHPEVLKNVSLVNRDWLRLGELERPGEFQRRR